MEERPAKDRADGFWVEKGDDSAKTCMLPQCPGIFLEGRNVKSEERAPATYSEGRTYIWGWEIVSIRQDKKYVKKEGDWVLPGMARAGRKQARAKSGSYLARGREWKRGRKWRKVKGLTGRAQENLNGPVVHEGGLMPRVVGKERAHEAKTPAQSMSIH